MKSGYARTAAVLGFVTLAAGLCAPLRPQSAAPALTALALIEPGEWQLRSRVDPDENRSICVGDPRILLQVRHGRIACTRFVIANEARETTVHYGCAGAGNGRTTLRVETPRLIQIESQGVADNEPFALQFEGRRVGACSGNSGIPPR